MATPPPRGSHRLTFTTLKTTMAVTGTVMALFVAVHMFGNLKAFAGPEAYNGYAAWLRKALHPLLPMEGLLWLMRMVLGTCLLLHIAAGTTLWLRGRAARGPYRRQGMRTRTIATSSMLLTGALIGVFVLVYLLDLTIGALVASTAYTPPTHADGALQVSAYQNLVASLSRPGMAVFYTAVMLGLSLHLAQGLWNVVVDLGGTGLAGSGAAAALGRLGYRVECFSIHDAARRAHSVAAQGGINAARARKVDGDSLARFVKDTVKGGDYQGGRPTSYAWVRSLVG